MTRVSILVPVLGRPHRVRPLLDSITAATPEPHEVVFLADQADRATLDVLRATDARVEAPGGSYAGKINHGVRATDAPLVFFAADDLNFHPGWLAAAEAKLTGSVGVVGVNDLIARRRDHATHFLVARWYAESPTIDGEPGPMHEGYHHWFVDDEFIATARHRAAYAYAPAAHVEHLHPMNGQAPDDDTYRKGRAKARLDRSTFHRRQPLWT